MGRANAVQLTVGRRKLRLTSYNSERIRRGKTIWRLTIVWANLREEANAWIVRSDAFLGLNPSEKCAISYFLGLTVAKLLAERLFVGARIV